MISNFENVQEHGFDPKVPHQRAIESGKVITITDFVPQHISGIFYRVECGFIICNVQKGCFQVDIVDQSMGSQSVIENNTAPQVASAEIIV